MDVALSAVTGSGKTLCYMLPMLLMVAEKRRTCGVPQLCGIVLVPTKALGAQLQRVAAKLTQGTPIVVESIVGDREMKRGAHATDSGRALVRSVSTIQVAQNNPLEETVLSNLRRKPISDSALYFDNVDILIATPQRLLKHLGGTPGFNLSSVSMFVVDEADQVLSGGFTNFVCRALQALEGPMDDRQSFRDSNCSSDLPMLSLSPRYQKTLHKMLCSATLSTHIARIAEVRLRNVKVFAMDHDGRELPSVDAGRLSTKFSLPPKLTEHMHIVEEENRSAVVLNVLRRVREQQTLPSDLNPTNDVGRSVVIFFAQADKALVFGKFLELAGIETVQFTAASSDADRRKAILRAGGRSDDGVVLVTTDALMRGVDLPGVGHVFMYDAPRSLEQYIHRVGRTARAGNIGHSHVFLSKNGPSGTTDDGEVACFKRFDKFLLRHGDVVYDRTLQQLSETQLEEAGSVLSRTMNDLMDNGRPSGAKNSRLRDDATGECGVENCLKTHRRDPIDRV
jgi:superfamily II DNA/RNA helicase